MKKENKKTQSLKDRLKKGIKQLKYLDKVIDFPKILEILKTKDKDVLTKVNNLKTPRVALITNSYPPNLNGVSKAVYSLEQSLLAKGIPTFIITPKVPGVEYKDNICPISSIASPDYISKDLRFSIYFNPQTIAFINKNNINIIHSQDAYHGGIDAVLLAKVSKAKSVHTYHTFMEDYEYFKVPGYKLYIRNYSNLVCNSYDTVVALSPKIKNYLNKIKIHKPIVEIPNVYIEPSKDNLLNSSNLDKVTEFVNNNKIDKTFNILTFGRVAKEKNIEEAIEYLKPILENNHNIRYIIAGLGPQIEELKEKVKILKLEDKIIFFDKFSFQEIKELSKYCKFFITTSYTEVQPTTPLEAMSFGLPVIAVNDSCYLYIIKDNINGFFRPVEELTDICEILIKNNKKLIEMQKQARLSYQNYIKIDFCQDYITLYQNLLDL
jgi:1,2-diacylglycerol 3-alpha-glucosyltransferase